MYCEEIFYRAQMAVEEIPYKVTITIFSDMESSISRLEKRGIFHSLEGIVCYCPEWGKMISSPCEQVEKVEGRWYETM